MPTAPPTLAMSTSWRIRLTESVPAVLDALRELGIRRVELNGLTPAQAEGVATELAARRMVAQSLHNPCPWPVDPSGKRLAGHITDGLACGDEHVRAQALAWARATIDLARRLGARAVVIHLGRVELSPVQGRLFELLRSGHRAEFADLRERALAEREAHKEPNLRQALASIRELGTYAAAAGVALGVEVRDGYDEIPNFREFQQVFAATAGLPVYYWHDVGHVEKQRWLGLATQADYLVCFRKRLLGVHLHDAILDRDHLVPGQGEIDLAAVARLLPAGALRTLELNSPPTPAEVRRGIALLARLGLA